MLKVTNNLVPIIHKEQFEDEATSFLGKSASPLVTFAPAGRSPQVDMAAYDNCFLAAA